MHEPSSSSFHKWLRLFLWGSAAILAIVSIGALALRDPDVPQVVYTGEADIRSDSIS
ncbi:hypothetical protein [Brevirhabdus pacifica]|uniref:hypothetical protein n=1 Tax=Brevirhabdus pacifica TaxID=1267768 RepID=UPI002AA4FA89